LPGLGERAAGVEAAANILPTDVDARASLQQEPDHLQMAAGSGIHQGGSVPCVQRVDLRTVVQEKANYVAVAGGGRVLERRVAPVASISDVRVYPAARQQRSHARQVAGGRGLEELALSFPTPPPGAALVPADARRAEDNEADGAIER